MSTAKPTPHTPPSSANRRARARAPAASPAPSAAPINDCAAIANASSSQRGEEPQLQGDLVGAHGGGAEPGGDRGGGQEAGLERDPPDEQVPAEHQLLADQHRAGPQARPLAQQRPDEQAARDGLGDHVGHRRAGQAQPGGVDQQRAEQRGEQVRPEHEQQRTTDVLDAAHPAVAGGGQQQAGRAEGRDPQPLPGRVGHLATTPGEGTRQRVPAELHADGHQHAHPECQPRRLDTLVQRPRPGRRHRTAGPTRPVMPYASTVPSQAVSVSTVPPTASAASGTRPRCPTTAVSTST